MSISRLYEYVALLRPVSPFTVPKGFLALRASNDLKKWPHGVAAYDKPLSRADIVHFDLLPTDPFDPVNVRRVITAWLEEVRAAFGKDEVLAVDDHDGGRLTLSFSTRPGVEFQVTQWMRLSPRSKRLEPRGHIDFNDFDRAALAMLTRPERARLVEKLVPVGA